ncbi:putative adhesin [Endozoicomonas lisbonensis]|uniref:Putative adhesin Stv domain-containing protein n=1 Tax=Endozoicomonas lisbonensis TaxID=3120522 RepID=A0ABV2SM56_9GAMM
MMNIAVLEGKLKLYSSELFDGKAQNLLIAAHGGVWSMHSFMGITRSVMKMHHFKMPPWATLYFYAPHGTATSTELAPYMKWRYPPLEAIMPGETVVNYDLGHVAGGLAYTTGPCAPAETSLKEVLDVLARTGRIYPMVHCIFCRHEYGTPVEEYTPGYQNTAPSL